MSTNGGFWPKWSRKGDRLFYTEADNGIWEVEVGLRPSVRLGSPRKLFARQRSGAPPVASGGPDGFDVTPDGTRFVVAQSAEQRGPAAITVVENWFAEFRNRR